MRRCPKCKQPMSTESFQDGEGDYLGYFCGNPECEDYDSYLAGAPEEEDASPRERT